MIAGTQVNLMKWACSFLLAAMLLAATVAVGQAQDKEGYTTTKYRVVRVPANVVDTEYNTDGRTRKPPIRPIHPLDELAAEGWELVTVVQADSASIKIDKGEAHGGDMICFLKKREPSSSLPGRR